jgi:hypothetical protein
MARANPPNLQVFTDKIFVQCKLKNQVRFKIWRGPP